MKLNQEILDNLEKKEFQFEVKEFDKKKGIIKGIASPYNNVDNGMDMVLPSIAKRNVGKKAPFLLQHTMATEQGDLVFYDSNEGLMAEIRLYMETMANGNPIFPEAYKSLVIAEKGMMKLSIGYVVHDYEYKMVGNVQVRLLKDIEIKELSRVTIPMNPKAVATEVKEGGDDLENKTGDKVEVKEMPGIKARLDGMMARDGMRLLMNAMRDMTYEVVNVPMSREDRMMQMGMIADEFAAMYKQYAVKICDGMPSEMKEANFELDVKFDELVLESKSETVTEAQMGQVMEIMMKGMEMLKKGMAVQSDVKGDKKDLEVKDNQDGNLEKKQEEEILSALNGILKKGE